MQCLDDVAQSLQLIRQQLVVAPGRRRPDRRKSAKLCFAVESVLDRVPCGIVLGGDAGPPPLEGRSQERQLPSLVTELIEGLQSAAQRERHSASGNACGLMKRASNSSGDPAARLVGFA